MDITKSPEDFCTLFTGKLEKIMNMLKLSQKKEITLRPQFRLHLIAWRSCCS
jgi:hypothetical protein